jgi:hypothetical protein
MEGLRDGWSLMAGVVSPERMQLPLFFLSSGGVGSPP